jgi:hypothetical protein
MNFPTGITDAERALMVVAYVVMRHGPAYVPLDRLERKVETYKAGDVGRRHARHLASGP